MPLVFKHTKPLWGVWKTDETSDELLLLLDRKEDYLPTLSSIRTENRKKEWLAVRVLAKELIGEELRIDYHANGAPYLSGRELYISITHTKGYVAVIFSHFQPVGIDIEYIGDRIRKIRSRFLSEEENRSIDAAHETEHLLIHWCAKETLFKMMGQENVDFINHLHIDPFPYKKEGRLTASETRSNQPASYTLYYCVFDDFIVTHNLTATLS